MKSLALRSASLGVATAVALLLASIIAHFTGYMRVGHLFYWQGTKMHVWFPCDGWVDLLCVRSPIDWQYFTFGLVFGSLIYAIGWLAGIAGLDLVMRHRMTDLRR